MDGHGRVRARWREGLAGLVAVVVLVALPGGAVAAVPERAGGPPARDFEVTTVSTRADMVSGGDVLVRIDVPRTVPLHQVRVTVGGRDVSGAFAPAPDGKRALLGLVEGLDVGVNTLEVRARGRGRGRPSATLALTNHPITGPVFSGPHQQPFICETEAFGLGPPLDEDCSVDTRVEYVYRSTVTDAFEPLDPSGPRPADVARTTTTEGEAVDFVVRVETGTINRAIYEIAFLHEPGTPLPDSWTTTPGWNRRLVYTFGGGFRASYRQGRWITGGSSGVPGAGVVEDNLLFGRALADGFAMASTTLNVFNNVGDDVVSAETAVMVKERFIEQYGEPDYTIGLGSSGGSMQQHLPAHNYPGLLDGLLPASSFPDGWTFIVPYLDCALVDDAFENSDEEWTEEEKAAVVGHRTYEYCTRNFPNWRTRIHATLGCDAAIPAALIFDPETNPDGVRCTIQDNQVNVFGTDPATGFARRHLDNVGIQYGLDAFNAGAITFEQFAELNERVGGFDINGEIVPGRMAGDPLAVATAYRTGRVNSGAGLDEVPIIDVHTYRDHLGDVHDSVRRFTMRERLVAANGHADNQVIWTDALLTSFPTPRGPYYEAFRLMDEWLAAIAGDDAPGSAAEKVVRNKPGDAVDACFTPEGDRITDPATCDELYPRHGNPRMAAGGPLTDDVLKCALRPVDASDYAQGLTGEQLQRLHDAFPQGVCDYGVPGVGQQPVAGTWLRY